MKLRRTKPPSAHWSTDFVEHIRTVHFSVMAACLALLALIQTRPKDLITAREQFVEIKQVVDNWDKEKNWIDSAINKKLAEKNSSQHIAQKTVRIEVEHQPYFYVLYADQFSQVVEQGSGIQPLSNSGTARLERNLQEWTNECHSVERDPAGIEFENWLQEKPCSLAGFRARWDQLRSGLYFVHADLSTLKEQVVLITQGGAAPAITSLVDVSTDTPNGERFSTELRRLTLEQREQSQVNSILSRDVKFAFTVSFSSNRELVFPVDAMEVSLRPGDMFLFNSHSGTSGYGSFSETFGVLDDVTSGKQQDSFAALGSRLDAELAQAKAESLQVFGVSIPAAIAAFWGTITILALQTYLWIHLHELSPRLKARRRKLRTPDAIWRLVFSHP